MMSQRQPKKFQWLFYSKSPTHVAFFVWPIVAGLFYWGSSGLLEGERGIAEVILLIMLGAFYWTLMEYLIHRFVFHSQTQNKWIKKIIWETHIHHHQDIQDPWLVNTGPLYSPPLAVVIFLPVWWVTGDLQRAFVFFAGTLMMFWFYEWVHYSVHMKSFKGVVMKSLQQHHLKHHHQNWGTRFGVSTTLWDFIFNTRGES